VVKYLGLNLPPAQVNKIQILLFSRVMNTKN
jgi:hypothetical protein